jgi:hypothetical protein
VGRRIEAEDVADRGHEVHPASPPPSFSLVQAR